MSDFEKLIQTLPEYKTLVFQHGERLFIKRDGEYEVLAVRLAYRLHVMATMTHVVTEIRKCDHGFHSFSKSMKTAFGQRYGGVDGYEKCIWCSEKRKIQP